MKRFIIILSILVLAFVFAACGNSVQSYNLDNEPMVSQV